jgi:diguanylate cyclase (GGDEF)-like protein
MTVAFSHRRHDSLITQLTRLNTAVLVGTILLVLFMLATAAIYSARERRLQQAELHAAQLAINLSSSLVFIDKQAASRELDALQRKNELYSVLVLDATGQIFVQSAGKIEPPWLAGARHYTELRWAFLQVKQPVRLDTEQVGTIVWTEQLMPMQLDLLRLFGIGLMLSAFAVLLAIRVSVYMQKKALAPMLELAKLADYAAKAQDYSVRGVVHRHDEVGRLTERFNELLKRIEIWQQDLHHKLQQSRAHNAELDLLAHRDALTGLHNRLSFETQLPALLQQHLTVTLMFVDLDNFKTVNDCWGHDAGDAVLKQVSERMSAELRSSDSLFRLGGDEFAILLPDMPEAATAERLAARIIHAVRSPMYINEQLMPVGATVGVACYPQDGRDAATLLKRADHAMYQAKLAGKNTWRFYAA